MTMPWLLLLLPLAAAVVNHLLFPRNGAVAAVVSTGAAVASLGVAAALLGKEAHASFNWIDLGGLKADVGLLVDNLSSRMMIVVTGVGALVHVFSLGYMREDEARARYFTGLSLFMFSMTGIVLADNFVMMFIFWELVA